MKTGKMPLLGLCPIGKFVFSHEDAIRQKQALQKRLKAWGIPFADLDGVLPDGLVRDQAHVEPAVRHFQAAGADALFLPHCNFGTEGAVGMIARKLELPVLLWGPRDEAPRPDGTRLRDSLCGLLASSKVLHKLGVPYSYIENCRTDDPPLRRGIDRFLRAANVASLFRKGMRIGHLGQRIDFFWCTISNESELLERFHVEVMPLDMVSFLGHVRQRVKASRRRYIEEAREMKRKMTIVGFKDDEPLLRVLAARDQMLALVKDLGLDGLTLQDFPSLVEELETYGFFANSLVADTVPLSMESDIHGAISTVLMQRATFSEQPVFLTEFTTRHPKDDHGVLLWHCGAPTAMCKPGARIELGHHWILPGPLAGMPHFPLRNGPITVTRFDGDRGEYRLAVGEGRSMRGPRTRNNYVWMKVDDWPRWEKLLMEGPFPHHTAMAYGHHAEALVEACRFIPDLEPLRLNHDSRR